MPSVATTLRTPAWWHAITSVYPSVTIARRASWIGRAAWRRPKSVDPFRNSADSGELRYFGSSSGSMIRAPKAIARPAWSRIGKTSRFRNVS